MSETSDFDAVWTKLGLSEDLTPEELASNKALLRGTWESSEQGLDYYQRQKKAASENISKATALEEQKQHLEKLRSAWKAEKDRLDVAVKAWEGAHDSMVRAIQPYSPVGIEQRAKLQMQTAEAKAQTLERSTSAVDASFIEELRGTYKQFYICSAISQSMQ